MLRTITAHALTDVGRKRDHNEDAYAFDPALGVYVVCDGMGGHASGEVASRLTSDLIVEFVGRYRGTSIPNLPYPMEQAGLSQPEALLSNAIQHANERVFVEGMKEARYEGMGTTVVAVLATSTDLVVAHVGDSRVYRYAGGHLEQVTRDHSLLNHKIDTGEIQTDLEIRAFRQGNIIVRAIGLKDYVTPEVQSVPRRAGDLFVLCSDGLTDMVNDAVITDLLGAYGDELDDGARALVDKANEQGGKDNITVMFVRIDDVLPEPLAADDAPLESTGRYARYPTEPSGFDVTDAMTMASTLQDTPAVSPEQLGAYRARRAADQRAATISDGLPTVGGDLDPGDTLPVPNTRRSPHPSVRPDLAEVFRGGAPPVAVSVEDAEAGSAPSDDDDDDIGFGNPAAFERTEPGVDSPARVVPDIATAATEPAGLAVIPRGDRARVQVSSGSATAQRIRPPTDPGMAPAEPSIIVEDEPPSIVIDDSLFD